MASIKKVEGKAGTSYKITVTRGTDSTGKQIRHFKTWKPDRPMTARQMEKEAQRVALEFERELDLGFQADDRQTFEEYANYFIKLQERKGAGQNTIFGYKTALRSLFPYIGIIKIKDIRPQQLNSLYRKLESSDVCSNIYVVPKIDFKSFLKKKGVSQRGLANGLGITTNTIQRICKGERVTIKTAAQISNFLETVEADIFKPIQSKKQITKDMIPRLRSKRGFMEKAPLPGSLSRACPTAGRGSFGTGWRSRTRRSGEAGISSWIC